MKPKQQFILLCSPQGGREYTMRAHFELPSVESEEMDSKRPITVNFEIPYFTVSGIQVGCYFHITWLSFASFLVWANILYLSYIDLI